MIIVIDGLSGSGKSTTARAVAEHFGIEYLDSGALYRAATLIWLEAGRPGKGFTEILGSKDIRFEYRDGTFRVCLNSRDISSEIRKQVVSDHVSLVAAMPAVRSFINGLMRKAVEDRDFIADGRDLGSAVFPDAVLKFFMKASLAARAERRYSEIRSDEEAVTLAQVKENLRSRDHADRNRKADPLVMPPDAYEIDTSGKTFDEQVKEVIAVINKKTDFELKP